jgi:heme exporter protein A
VLLNYIFIGYIVYMLTLNNITCSKGGRILFTNLSYTIGDCCALLIKGENGSGKTSLLNIIAGLAKPDKGDILYANEKVNGRHWPEFCSIIHYIGHKNALKPELTVEENINFWVKLRRSEGRLSAALRFFDLDQYANIQCSKLSQGWQKKVALAKLLACSSQIWLLDEPYAHLDEDSSLKLTSLINTRVEQGGSVILTTHKSANIANAVTIDLEDFAC